MSAELTPMMRQYLEIKDTQKDAILFFRLGDFYEMFFNDAVEASKILHIALTSREAGKGNKVPMCGIPHHASANYLARLVKHGRKVAICDQVEEPEPGKKLVERKVTRIITPGTFIADEILEESVNNYILSLNFKGGVFGLAYADISTGEFRLTELDDIEALSTELYKISPSECLVPGSLYDGTSFDAVRDISLGVLTRSDDWMFDEKMSEKDIKRRFSVDAIDGFGCHEMPVAVGAAGALLKYLEDTQKKELKNIDRISTYRVSNYMSLDRNSHRHLELIQNNEDMTSKGTVFDVIDRTKTPMGRRKLKRYILNPLIEKKDISARLDAVQYFYDNGILRKTVRDILEDMYDAERLSNKVSLGTANARDLVSLVYSLRKAEALKASVSGDLPELLDEITAGIEDIGDVVREIEEAIVDAPPLTVRDGGLIRPGYSAEVDELRSFVSGSKDWLAELQRREAERTGIGSLKVGFNKIFGYYIEITNSKLSEVPADYIRKQTLVNAERFITEELKEKESKIISSGDRLKELEYRVFCGLRDKMALRIDELKNTSDAVAGLDVFSGLAETAADEHYTRPSLNVRGILDIEGGRHPVLEKILKDKAFVPNDLSMDPDDNRIFIITGSNMAGKSTFIRQTALITIMAQMGSFVPASRADIGIVDRVFTRVGASDRLYKGMSTFMVEMLETANILNNATDRSLIILDEIGRGTSTFDGVSIAWAVVEYIHHHIKGAKAMFATHYHELTELSQILDGVKNYHLEVQEWGKDIIFLYKAKEGSCDESFGIHVAKLAGMPKHVVERSREILENLRKDSIRGSIKKRFSEHSDGEKEKQIDFFTRENEEHPVLGKIRALNVNKMTPLEALEKIAEMKKEIGE
ncbi:MAG: DNA mismatch repair protein MutS [Candidatus Omnitrophica bacterium]|nr:DNA mismatch repair protein MutS [Candidatus Omnitrophota bacterium]